MALNGNHPNQAALPSLEEIQEMAKAIKRENLASGNTKGRTGGGRRPKFENIVNGCIVDSVFQILTDFTEMQYEAVMPSGKFEDKTALKLAPQLLTETDEEYERLVCNLNKLASGYYELLPDVVEKQLKEDEKKLRKEQRGQVKLNGNNGHQQNGGKPTESQPQKEARLKEDKRVELGLGRMTADIRPFLMKLIKIHVSEKNPFDLSQEGLTLESAVKAVGRVPHTPSESVSVEGCAINKKSKECTY